MKLPTREEHIARAMLMGREYDETDGTYCIAEGDPEYGWVIDCLTFEVVDWDRMTTDELIEFQRRGEWES